MESASYVKYIDEEDGEEYANFLCEGEETENVQHCWIIGLKGLGVNVYAPYKAFEPSPFLGLLEECITFMLEGDIVSVKELLRDYAEKNSQATFYSN